MEYPKVSVIVPCYNSSQYIKETIESALLQSYNNIEILCVNDGSTDNTRKILEDFGNDLTILEHPGGKNKGQYKSVNLAIRSTKSDFIAILEHDDIWFPDKVKLQMEILLNHHDVDLVYTNGYNIDSIGKIMGPFLPDGHKETNNPEIHILKGYIVPSCTIARRSVIEKIGYFNENTPVADHDFFLKAVEIGKLSYLDIPLFCRRIHPAQQSTKRKLREDGFVLLRDATLRYPYKRKTIRKRIAVLHYSLGEWDYLNGHILRGGYHFFLAAVYDFKRGIKERNVWMNVLKRRWKA